MLRRNGLLGLSVIFTLMAFLGLAMAGEGGNALDLRVMQYNLRNENTVDPSPHTWKERLPAVKQLIEQENPDIFGTQEGLYVQLRDIAGAVPEYNWIGVGREGGSKGEFTAVFYKSSRFIPVEYDDFWLSETPNQIASATWGNTYPRMVTWVKFRDKTTGREFYFINTHFDHESDEARVKGAELLLKKTDTLDKALPVILTGDFNSYYTGNAHKILVGKNGFTDTWDTAKKHVNAEYGTFNGFTDPTGKIGAKMPGRGDGDRMDWILYRGNITVNQVAINPWRNHGTQFPSDHFPIIADLTLKY